MVRVLGARQIFPGGQKGKKKKGGGGENHFWSAKSEFLACPCLLESLFAPD